jgi:hypothetical protein
MDRSLSELKKHSIINEEAHKEEQRVSLMDMRPSVEIIKSKEMLITKTEPITEEKNQEELVEKQSPIKQEKPPQLKEMSIATPMSL